MFALTVALVLTQAEPLAKHDFTGVSIRAPKSWSVTNEDETSKEWASSDDRAQMAFSAFPVDPVRPARACVKQLIAAVQDSAEPDAGVTPSPFTNTTIGGQPAAKKITTDFIGEGDADKVEANKVTTTTIVGCNGKTKWLLTFSNRTNDGAKSGALLKRVVDSLTYAK